MSQRDSGYQRKERDLYETPAWVTEVLVPHLRPGIAAVWEPACGSGKMVQPLERTGFRVVGTDIATGENFLDLTTATGFNAIITNPPYVLALEFIEHALRLMEPQHGTVAMLLRADYDSAKTRQHLFGQCPQFSKKVVLTERIRWIEGSNGSPSFNHGWYIWEHTRPPTLAYAP